MNLETGQPAAVRSMLNRQQPLGADVIWRISATMLDPGALQALQLQVIGDVEPVAMCASGLVDCVAELVREGLIDRSRRFVDDETAARARRTLAERLTFVGQERVFVLRWRGGDAAESV